MALVVTWFLFVAMCGLHCAAFRRKQSMGSLTRTGATVRGNVSAPSTQEEDEDSFECPVECWECCAVHAQRTGRFNWVGIGKSRQDFKCILRNNSQLPSNYVCEDPTPRKHQSTAFKTYCSLNTSQPWWMQNVAHSTRKWIPGAGLVDSTLRRRKTLSNLEHCQSQSRIARLTDWLWQKKGELINLANPNMLEMFWIMKTIRSQARTVPKLVPLSALSSIHPIDEPGAIEKTASRARAARDARSVLDRSPHVLSKELIFNYPALQPLQSVTGFDVVEVADGEYVTFEGNGRCVALLWAFPEGDGMRDRLNIEVADFVIDDVDKRNEIVQRIKALQKAMGSKQFAAMYPPSLDDDVVSEWATGVKAELRNIISQEQ